MIEETTPNGGTLRLFVGLPVPQQVKDQLGSLPRKGLEASWSSADDFHITLRYLGDLDAGALPEIKAALDRVRRPPFGVELNGLGTFQTGRQAVLWADVQSTRKMTALAAEINAAIEPLGFEMPRKPFRPHITIARVKKPQGLERYCQDHKGRIRASWEAASFGLFQSVTPDKKGNKYSLLQECKLR